MAKVLFHQRDGYECFGAMYLSATLKARGHTTDVLIQTEEGRNFLALVDQAQPDVVAFSIMSGLHEWTAATARMVKERIKVPVVAGGPHCTFFPEFVEEPGLDAICRGEAEDAFPDLVDALAAGGDGSDVPGFWVKTDSGLVKNDLYPLRETLDSLPKPDRNLYSTRYPQISLASASRDPGRTWLSLQLHVLLQQAAAYHHTRARVPTSGVTAMPACWKRSSNYAKSVRIDCTT